MSKIIIGLTGVKTSGKTTSFSILKELNPEIQEITLAKNLKDASAVALGVDRSLFDDPKTKEVDLEMPVNLDSKNVNAIFKYLKLENVDFDKHVRPHIGKILHTPRQIAQYVGTEVLRNYDEDIHCNLATRDLPDNGVFVVTDMRFQGEFNYFNERFPTTFYPVYVSNRVAELKIDDHPSEKQVLEVAKRCERVDNNGSLQDLKFNLTKFYNEIMEFENERMVKTSKI